MGIGTSILLITIGLILALAIDADIEGVDIQVIGYILVAAGIIGLVISLFYTMSASDRRRGRAADDPYDPPPPPRDRY